MGKHYSKDELMQHIREGYNRQKLEAMRQVSDELTPQIYAAIALAIMTDPEDDRTEDARFDYIVRIFNRSQEVWTEVSQVRMRRSWRLILKRLKDDYGIDLMLKE